MPCSHWYKPQILSKLFMGPKYDGKALHEQIKLNLPENIKVSDTLANIVVPTFDVKKMKPVIFSTFEAENEAHKNAVLADVCIGTSAAPTYFPPVSFTTEDADGNPHEFHLIDGGVVANNPTMAAMSMLNKETLRLRQNPDDSHTHPRNNTRAAMLALSSQALRENKGKEHVQSIDYKSFVIISIGTGSAKRTKEFSAEDRAKWGQYQWITNSDGASIIDVFSQASVDMVDIHATVRFQDIGCEKNYLRIQVFI